MPQATHESKGFGSHGRRNLLELLAFLVVLALVLVGARSCVGCAAERAAAELPPEVDGRIGELAGDEVRGRYGVGVRAAPPESARVEPIFESLRAALTAEESIVLTRAGVLAVKDEQVNAFALPGGEVFVLTGLVARTASDEDALAGVLAHELGHAVRRHGVRLAAREAAFAVALALLLGDLDDSVGAIGGAAAELDGLSHSRAMEDEADAFAVDLLRRAGRDPEGLARFLEALEAQPVPELLSTHPDPGERAKTVRALARP